MIVLYENINKVPRKNKSFFARFLKIVKIITKFNKK